MKNETIAARLYLLLALTLLLLSWKASGALGRQIEAAQAQHSAQLEQALSLAE